MGEQKMTKELKIQIILGSTRDARQGEKAAKFIYEFAKKRKDFSVEYIDLKEWNFQFLNEASPPSMGNYSDPKTKKWASKINESDGYIFVTPEYNHGYSAVLKNALDLIYKEWNNKPGAFVSYGGAAGSRAVEQLRQVLVELQMAPIRAQVMITSIWTAFDSKGELINKEMYEKSTNAMFDQLVWWAHALKSAREKT